MKVNIEYVEGEHDTEVYVKCSDKPDERTRKLLHKLAFFTDEITGYREGRVYRLWLDDIYFIDSADDKIFLYVESEVYETPKKLYEWEAQLKDTAFVRISKSTIVNTDKLKCVRPVLGGKMEATMINGEKQIVNRHYLQGFRVKFGV